MEALVAVRPSMFAVASKDGPEGVSGYDGTWVTGERSRAGRVNGASGRSGCMNGGGSGANASQCEDCIKWRTLRDDLAANYMLLNQQK